MPCFNVSLAEIPIGISAIYSSTKAFFDKYLTDDTPVFYVTVTLEDIEFERVRSAVQDEKDGIPVRKFSDNYLETLAVLRKVAEFSFDHDTALFHGSAVAVDGKAYLFTAPSGTGKTTHTGLWLDLFPKAYILNGDKPFIKIKNGQVFVCGTPWRGKERCGCNEILPLEAICLLERGSVNSIVPIKFNQALEALMRQIYRPEAENGMLKALQMCEKIGTGVRLYRLRCNMDPEAAVVSSSAMLAKD